MATLAEIRRILIESEYLKGKQSRHIAFKQQLKALLERSGQGVWEWNRTNNQILFDGQADLWVDYMGYSADEVDLGFEWLYDKLHPESREAFVEAIQAYISHQVDCHELEYRVRNKAGDWIWFWARGLFTDFDEENNPTRMIGVYRNITDQKEIEFNLQQINTGLEKRVLERTRQLSDANRYLMTEINQRKRIEENLHWAKEQAENANRMKTEFLANISHELRTPLHHILNYAKFGVEKNEKPRDQLVHYFRQIRKSGKRLEVLLNDLLDLSSLELGRSNYLFCRADIYELVQEVGSELESMCREKSVGLDIKPAAVSTIAVCDKGRISQVIYNLLSNAIKFTPVNKQISVVFDQGILSVLPDPEKALKVSVYDQGVGIPEGEQTSIFDAFTQSSRTNSGAGGTGLGLSISKKIVDDHQGRIWADNRPEGGAVFSFMLPYR